MRIWAVLLIIGLAIAFWATVFGPIWFGIFYPKLADKNGPTTVWYITVFGSLLLTAVSAFFLEFKIVHREN